MPKAGQVPAPIGGSMKTGILSVAFLLAVMAAAEDRTTGHETNYRIAAARCSVAKRCWPDRAKVPCDQADRIKAQVGATGPTGLFPSDLNQCLDAVEKADCSTIQLDLIRFMTRTDNVACQGYGEYYRHAGRYAAKK